ncbi:MAG: alpha/beta hydrolase [Thermomicrobiales bacterium]|nr:alpha/beta hydrolase [Thermomicrobiales bacterium]
MVNLGSALTLGGCTIRFADSGGCGQPVVLLHGAGLDHEMFDAQAGRLLEVGHRVIRVDLRAHGASRPNSDPLSAEQFVLDMEALIAHAGLARPALVGQSLGGNIAQRLVQRAPGAYSRLSVLDATWNTGPLTLGERLVLRAAAPMLALMPWQRLRASMADASASSLTARAYAERTFARMSKPEFIAVWRATAQFISPDPAYRTAIPLLLARGASDRLGNIAAAMPAWAMAEGVAEAIIPGAGHIVTLDAPDAMNDVLLRFFATRVGAA